MKPRNDLSTENLIQLYMDGFSIVELAEKFNTNANTIAYRLKRSGCKSRSIKEALAIAKSRGRRPVLIGTDNPNYKGGTISYGYKLVYQRNSGRYIPEHVIVWQETHGKRLPRGWVVHHINGIKLDNRPKNLIALKRGAHLKKHSINYYQIRIRQLEEEIYKLKQGGLFVW